MREHDEYGARYCVPCGPTRQTSPGTQALTEMSWIFHSAALTDRTFRATILSSCNSTRFRAACQSCRLRLVYSLFSLSDYICVSVCRFFSLCSIVSSPSSSPCLFWFFFFFIFYFACVSRWELFLDAFSSSPSRLDSFRHCRVAWSSVGKTLRGKQAIDSVTPPLVFADIVNVARHLHTTQPG